LPDVATNKQQGTEQTNAAMMSYVIAVV